MIGILSFHRALNYGANLQVLAMQNYLTQNFTEVEVINYIAPGIEQENSYFNLYKRSKNMNKKEKIKNIIKCLLYFKINYTKHKSFSKFQKKNYNLSEKRYDHSNFDLDYDTVIVGSDQVFNTNCTNNDLTFYLKNINVKKISYAGSFGCADMESLNCFPIELLKNFSNLSIRENAISKPLSIKLNKDISFNVDPTLLLNSNQWSAFSTNISKPKKYVLLYLMDETLEMIQFAERLAKLHNLKIVYITSLFVKRCNAIYYRGIGPDEWLDLFLNATYIITNSFHGIMFSLNFNKEFYWGTLSNNNFVNGRLLDAARFFGIENRNIENKISEINWKEINKKIEFERKRTKSYFDSVGLNYE